MEYQHVTVCFADKQTIYNNIYDALRSIGRENIDTLTDSSHFDVSWDRFFRVWRRCAWASGTPAMLFDAYGLRISVETIRHYANITRWPDRYEKWRKRHRYVFRQGPVQGISKRRYRCRWRGMRTTQEIRENDFVRYHDEDCLEYNIKPRASRRPGWPYLPTLYDDVFRSERGHSWKNHRCKQWKGSGSRKSRRRQKLLLSTDSSSNIF